jgi:hypothetical protein
MEILSELELNVMALFEIETTTQQDLERIREVLALLDRRQRLQTARMLRLERRVRVLEWDQPQ